MSNDKIRQLKIEKIVYIPLKKFNWIFISPNLKYPINYENIKILDIHPQHIISSQN